MAWRGIRLMDRDYHATMKQNLTPYPGVVTEGLKTGSVVSERSASHSEIVAKGVK